MTKRYIKLFDEHGRSLKSVELEPRTVSALPVAGERLGEMVHNTTTGRTYVWDGSEWQLFGFTRIPHVRQSVLAQFSDPKLLICTSSMNEVYYSADKVEHTAGNITSNSQELTIVGGSATAEGHSWVYWNLPETATRAYIRVQMNSVNAASLMLEACDSDASLLDNPPDRYYIALEVPSTGQDLKLKKGVGGIKTTLAYESVDLSYNTYYDLELCVDVAAHTLEAWRDGAKKFEVSDSDITQIASVRMRMFDDSTSEAQSGKLKGPLVVIYE